MGTDIMGSALSGKTLADTMRSIVWERTAIDGRGIYVNEWLKCPDKEVKE